MRVTPPPHWYTPPWAEANSNPSTLLMTPHLYHRSHTYTGHACLKSPSRRLSIQGQTVLTQAANQRLWYHLLGNPRGQNWGDLTRMKTEPNPHKRMTPPSTQNLKALGLWVFFLICCSTFSLLLNVGLRLTLGYRTISPSSESSFHIGTLPLERKHSQTRVHYSWPLTCTTVHTLIRDMQQ